MSKEAMKLALEWIEAQPEPRMIGALNAITALREALASEAIEQPAQQEPVFWTRKQWGMDREFCEKPFTTDWEPLYTSPPAQRTWVGLDNDDLVWIYSNSDNVGQAISNTEAKLKEKNT